MSCSIPYGKRLLSHVVDERAAQSDQTTLPYASIAQGASVQEGYRDISYATFANAINRAAQWLWDVAGKSEQPQTITYIGPFDLRYQILSLAVVKSNHILFLPSPRNTPDALQSLIEDAKSTHLITPDTPIKPVQVALSQSPELQHVVIPPLPFFLDETPVPAIPLEATWDELRYKTWLIIHTSGSTGNAKLVRLTHGYATAIDGFQLLEDAETCRFHNTRLLLPFPPFHVAGITYSFAVAVFYSCTAIYPPVGTPLTADLINSMHHQTPIDHYIIAPSLVSDLAKNDAYLEDIKRLKGLTFAGGPLGVDTARIVSERTTLSSGFGASEYGTLATKYRDAEDWQYYAFNMDHGGVEMRPIDGEDGLFELVLIRQPALDLVQGVFCNYPDLDEFHTKDLFSKHPTKQGLFKFQTRLDDIMVLTNGENLNPVPMEGTITSCPVVKGCVIAGQAQPHTIALIEPANPDISKPDLFSAIQPYITKANALCPAYGKLSMNALLVLSPDQAFPRAAKGTIQRSAALRMFASHIQSFYSSMDQDAGVDTTSSGSYTIDTSTPAALEASIMKFLKSELNTSDIRPDDDFFAVGTDSLMVINLVRAINRSRDDPIDVSLVYNNATVTKLVRAIQRPPRRKEYSDFVSDDEESKEAWLDMEKQFRALRRKSSKKQAKSVIGMLQSSRSPPIFQPSRGWLAWSQVLGAFLVNLNNWGLVNSFGVYQAYYQTGQLASYSPSAISWIGTVQGTLLLVVGVLSGPLFDKGFFHAILIGGGLLLVVSLMLLSLAKEYYQIMLCQGILSGLCLGLLYIPSVAMIPLYFKRHRGLALGVATAGGSLGGVIYPIVFRRLIQVTGFGWANRIIGFITLGSLGLAAALIKPVGKRSTRQLLDFAALKELPYSTFLVAAFFLFAGVMVPFFLSPSFSAQEIRLSQDKSFYYLCIMNAAQFVGRVSFGGLSDSVGPEILLSVAQLGSAILAFCWIVVSSEAGFIVWSIFYGLASGAIVTLPAAVLPYISPNLAVLGTRLGMVYAMAGVGFLISTPVALALNEKAESFLGSQLWTGCCCVVGALFYIVTCREAWARRRLYESRNRR